MIKQKEKSKNREKIEQYVKCIFAIIILLILLKLVKYCLLGIIYSILEYGSATILITYLYMPYVNFLAFAIIAILLCIGTIYDTISFPKKIKEIEEAFKANEKIPIKIQMISKKNAKKDCDLLQAYKVEWKFVNKTIPHIQTETIFYTDEPDFMFKYRNKETFIEYDDKYFNNYRINFDI